MHVLSEERCRVARGVRERTALVPDVAEDLRHWHGGETRSDI